MIGLIAVIVGSAIILAWGAAHIVPVRSVVKGFGEISSDNRRIITMEWISEGLTLCFIGVLVLLVCLWAGANHPASILVYRSSAVMLLVMAGLTLFTGAKTSMAPIKICPIVKTTAAALLLVGSIA